MTFGVTISTVYLGFHHAMDSIFGLIWEFLNYLIISKLLRKSHIHLHE
jgi:membrane-associated phospholipid phosphatase